MRLARAMGTLAVVFAFGCAWMGCRGDSIIHIGAIFEESALKDQEAFSLAVADINANEEILQSEQITYSIRTVEGDNPFQALQEACELMEQGILALVSSTGCATASSLQSLSDAMHIPHLFVERGGPAASPSSAGGAAGTGGSPRSGCELPPHPPPLPPQTTTDPGAPGVEEPQGYTLTARPPAVLGHVLTRVLADFAWRKFILFYQAGYDIRGVRGFLARAARQGAEVSLQQVDGNVGRMIASLFRSLKYEELNRYRDSLRRAVLLLNPRLARTFIAEAADSNLVAADSHWIYVNEEVSLVEVQELARVSVGRLTVLRQVFPAPRDPAHRCERDGHHVSPALCDPQDPAYMTPEVSSLYIYDSVVLLTTAFHQKLEDRKWHSMASLSCLKRWTKPWNGGHSMLDVIRQGRVWGLTGELQFNELGVNPHVQFEVLGTSYADGGQEKTVRRLALWDPKNGLNGTLRDRLLENNLKGVTLRVVTVLDPPFVMMSDNVLGQPKRFVGFAVDVLEELSRHLGFTYDVYQAPDNSYGRPGTGGSWSGLLGEILNKRADVGIGAVTITPERESVVDFTKRFMDRGVAIMLREQHHHQRHADLFSCLAPFAPTVWAGLAACVPIVALVVHRLNTIGARRGGPGGTAVAGVPGAGPACQREGGGGVVGGAVGGGGIQGRPAGGTMAADARGRTWPGSLWLVYGSLMQQGGELVLMSVSARVMVAVWWFFTLIVVSSYTASLAAYLTLSRLTSPISSLQELARQTEMSYGTVLHSSLYEQLRARAANPVGPEHGTYAKLWEAVSRNNGSDNCVHDLDEAVHRVKRGNYAFVWDTAVLEFAALSDGDCSLSVRNVGYDKGYGIALQHGSPYRDAFSQRLLELQESGELEALRQKWWPRRGKCDPYGPGLPQQRPPGLELSSLAGAFAVLAAGLLLACLLGACEACWHRRSGNLCPPNEDKELEMEQVHPQMSSSSSGGGGGVGVGERGMLDEGVVGGGGMHKPFSLPSIEMLACEVGAPRDYRSLAMPVNSFLPEPQRMPPGMAMAGPESSSHHQHHQHHQHQHHVQQQQQQPPLVLKHRAPNGGLQRQQQQQQSPLKSLGSGRVTFQAPSGYIPEQSCETMRGTSI
ncbi:glutamate receptor ionotropic, delta-1-like isoform X2 [Lampetra fluviatilis]